jgi:hypothetical protein
MKNHTVLEPFHLLDEIGRHPQFAGKASELHTKLLGVSMGTENHESVLTGISLLQAEYRKTLQA